MSLVKENVVTIEDLLELKSFKHARIIAGENGINKKITWAHIMEVTEVGSLINGGELILTTGLGWANNQTIGTQFLQALINESAVGMCIELNTYIAEVSNEMIDLANQHDFPMIIFENQVRFIDLTKQIYEILQTSKDYVEIENMLKKLWNGHTQLSEKEKFIQFCFQAKNGSCLSAFLKTNSKHTLTKLVEAFRSVNISVYDYYISEMRGYFLIIHLPEFLTISIMFEMIYTLDLSVDQRLILSAPIHSFYELVESVPVLKHMHQVADKFSLNGVLTTDNLQFESMLYAIHQSPLSPSWFKKYIEPVINYDQANGTQLLETLETLLACHGNKNETAKKLFVVRQTLYNRIDKLSQMIGEDFLSPEKRLLIETMLNFAKRDRA